MGTAEVGAIREGAEASIMSSSSSSAWVVVFGRGNREEVSMGEEGFSVMSVSGSLLEGEVVGFGKAFPSGAAGFLWSFRLFLRFVGEDWDDGSAVAWATTISGLGDKTNETVKISSRHSHARCLHFHDFTNMDKRYTGYK